MAHQIKIRTTFEPTKSIQPIFTRGNVALCKNGRILASCVEEDVLLSDLRTGTQLAKIQGVRCFFSAN
jgi:U3 small nucleolar RNA-associated protein 13